MVALTSGLFAGGLVLATGAMVRVAAGAGREGDARRRLGTSSSEPPSLPAPPPRVAALLAAAAVPVEASLLWSGWLAGGAVLLALAAVAGGPGLALVATGAWCAAPVVALSSVGRRSDARIEAAVPLALDAVARALRSGASLLQALTEAAAASPPALRAELVTVTTAADRGLALVPALEEWAAHRPTPGVRLTVAALCLGAETGGAQARAIDGVAATLRQRLAVAGEARSLATQSRLSGVVIAVSPIVFCGLAVASEARVATLLFRTPLGWTLLATGLLFDAVGALWMARLTRPTV